MAGYIGKSQGVTQVDGYTTSEADSEFVNDPNAVITVSGSNVGIGTSSPNDSLHIATSAFAGLTIENTSATADPVIKLLGDDGNYWSIHSDVSENDKLQLRYNNSTKIQFDPTGGIYLGGTGSANLLDDYEEGTWTPILDLGTGITYSYQAGKYTKIGNLVHCEGTIGVSAMSADASGVHITLPFAAPSAHQAVSGGLGHDTSLLGSKATNNVGFGVFGNNMFMFETGSNANYIVYNEVTANVPGTIVFSVTYRLA